MKTHRKLLATTAFASVLAAPFQVGAQTAYAERSEPVVLGQEIHLYSLPTKNAAGNKTQYFDVTVTLQLNANGTLLDTATVAAAKSPAVKSSLFVVGSYANDDTTPCTLRASAFNGRTQYDLHCVSGSDVLDVTWFSGLIAGHPYEAALVDAGLDTIPGNQDLSWGRVGFAGGGTWFGCFNAAELVSARQVADRITLVNYGSNTIVDCQTGFNRTQP